MGNSSLSTSKSPILSVDYQDLSIDGSTVVHVTYCDGSSSTLTDQLEIEEIGKQLQEQIDALARGEIISFNGSSVD